METTTTTTCRPHSADEPKPSLVWTCRCVRVWGGSLLRPLAGHRAEGLGITGGQSLCCLWTFGRAIACMLLEKQSLSVSKHSRYGNGFNQSCGVTAAEIRQSDQRTVSVINGRLDHFL
jgi:hypothetical protein